MKAALSFSLIKNIYDNSATYYDRFHHAGTFGLDEKGRKFLVNKIIKPGDFVLDAGGGTGNTAIKSLIKSGKTGKAIVLDFSKNMLKQALEKAAAKGLSDRLEIREGDMYDIPFPDNTFDVVLSTYSTCPLADPILAVKEMLRVTKKNGQVGVAHSTEPENRLAVKISRLFDYFLWKFPGLSLGCRNIHIIEEVKKLPVEIEADRIIGFIPFYFRLIILRKL